MIYVKTDNTVSSVSTFAIVDAVSIFGCEPASLQEAYLKDRLTYKLI